jgi:hypothetical protein
VRGHDRVDVGVRAWDRRRLAATLRSQRRRASGRTLATDGTNDPKHQDPRPKKNANQPVRPGVVIGGSVLTAAALRL